jgi:hypothetical protein
VNESEKTIQEECYGTCWGAQQRIDELTQQLNAANERISKLYDYVAALETGGDLMANELSFGYDVDLWNKARGEAKP